jgi:alpha-1,2-mannosyltransferase
VAVAALMFGALFALFAPTSADNSSKQLNLDAWSANYESWTLATTGSPWLDHAVIPQLANNPQRSQWITVQPNGHTVITRVPGVVAAALPAYWLMHPSHMTTAPGGLTAAFLEALAVTLLFLALKERLPLRVAALSALAFGVSTPVWSVAADGMWPHTVTVLGIAGMVWAATSDRWWVVGIFGGITLWGRLHAAVIVAILGLFVGWRRRDLSIVLRVGVASGAFLLVMSWWTHWMYGSWNPMASYDTTPFADYAKNDPFNLVNQAGMWVSPARGFFVWTPVALLLLPALVRSWRELPDWSRALVYGGVFYTCLQALLNRFTGGDFSYGYRLTLEMLACATPAFAMSARRAGRWARLLLGPLLALQVVAIAFGAVSDKFFVGSPAAWRANPFVLVLDQLGPMGLVLVALTLGLGGLAARMWASSGHPRQPRAVAADLTE